MTPQYSAMENTNLAAPARTGPRAIEAGDARALTTGRQLHIAGDNLFDAIAHLRPNSSAIVAAAAIDRKQLRKLRGQYPNVPLLIEPAAIRDSTASADDPFVFDAAENSLLPQTLNSALQDQRDAGAHLAITPTAQIESGPKSGPILRSIVKAVNALDRDDTIVALPLEDKWLDSESGRTQIRKVIEMIKHPVAIMFYNRDNPLNTDKRLKAYRQIFIDAPGQVIAYRTDTAGFDALAHGALTSAIGAYPSLRRLTPAGGRGRSGNRSYAPHVYFADLGCFVQSVTLQQRWFANAEPMLCSCIPCDGKAVDRFRAGKEHRAVAHCHNVREIDRVYASSLGKDPQEILDWWKAQVRGSLDAYQQLERHIEARIRRPDDISFWAQLLDDGA